MPSYQVMDLLWYGVLRLGILAQYAVSNGDADASAVVTGEHVTFHLPGPPSL